MCVRTGRCFECDGIAAPNGTRPRHGKFIIVELSTKMQTQMYNQMQTWANAEAKASGFTRGQWDATHTHEFDAESNFHKQSIRCEDAQCGYEAAQAMINEHNYNGIWSLGTSQHTGGRTTQAYLIDEFLNRMMTEFLNRMINSKM